jgi:penicillin-insensitive murein DD-endopeptidase
MPAPRCDKTYLRALAGLVAVTTGCGLLVVSAGAEDLPWLKKGWSAQSEKLLTKTKDNAAPVAETSTPTAAKAPKAKAPDAKPVAAADDKPPPKPIVPAKKLFGAKKSAANMRSKSIGFYSKGCLSGAARLPDNGEAWQAMRLSRNRHWGHPKLVALLQRFAKEAKEHDGWPGMLFGDISQPRGGPMLSGHASHQVGLDADVWLTPMPDRKLSYKERENLSATSMLAKTITDVNPKVWTDSHVKIIKRAASYPTIERILVHPAIKKALCQAAGDDNGWLGKVRPYWGHYYHFHLRMKCQPGSSSCRPQKPPTGDPGCGKELDYWIKMVTPRPPPKKPKKPAKKRKPKPPLTVEDLPPECKSVLAARPASIEWALNKGVSGR